jgi:hypothetical protein
MSDVNQELTKFLKALTEKNYAEANKYLQATIDSKMIERIKNAKQK